MWKLSMPFIMAILMFFDCSYKIMPIPSNAICASSVKDCFDVAVQLILFIVAQTQLT